MARDISRFTTSAHASYALFLGTERTRILDRRDSSGDLPTPVDDAVAWILTKTNVEFIIRHVRREERRELPEEALREGRGERCSSSRLPLDGERPDLPLQGPHRDRESGGGARA